MLEVAGNGLLRGQLSTELGLKKKKSGTFPPLLENREEGKSFLSLIRLLTLQHGELYIYNFRDFILQVGNGCWAISGGVYRTR